MPNALQAVANSQTPERRSFQRQRVLHSCMELEDDNGGVILDLSESGLAMQVARSLADKPLPQIRFQLSPSSPWIETRGRITWTSSSKTRAGMEFVGLSYTGRILIKRWIASIGSSSAAAKASVEEIAPPVEPARTSLESENAASVRELAATERVVENPGQDIVAKDPAGAATAAETVSGGSGAESAMPAGAEDTRGASPPPLYLYEKTTGARGMFHGEQLTSPLNSRQRIGVLVLVASVSALFLSIHFGNARNNMQTREAPATVSQPALPSNGSVIPKSPPTSVDLKQNREVAAAASQPALPSNALATLKNAPIFVNPKQPFNHPGFVLQVGAMTHKENADALEESLRERNFPVFVSHRGTDRFYRVLVGPYSDVDSTLRAEEEIRKEGLESIRTRWNPSLQ